MIVFRFYNFTIMLVSEKRLQATITSV